MSKQIDPHRLKEWFFEFCSRHEASRFFDLRRWVKDYLGCRPDPSTSRPKNFDGSVSKKNFGETAFQRALFNATTASIRIPGLGVEERLSWLDGELPVTIRGSARRRCVDLVAETAGRIVLAELKYASNPSHQLGRYDIHYAIAQVVAYLIVVGRHPEKLSSIGHLGLRPVRWGDLLHEPSRLLIIANPRYWNRKSDAGAIWDEIRKILDQLSQFGVALDILRTDEEFFFEEQAKVLSERYRPQATKPVALAPVAEGCAGRR